MCKCPHCGKPGISVWRKLNIGLFIPTICKQCGNKVGVPYSAGFIIALFTITIGSVAFFVDSIMLKIAIWVVATLIMSGIYRKYVPLVPKYK
jgi:hypothetical protein